MEPVMESGLWYTEMWRGLVVVAASVLVGGLIRVFMERTGKLPKRIERNGPSPGLALLNIAGALYIIIDITRNIGATSFNWWETPLASVIVISGAYMIGQRFLRKRAPG